MTKEKEPGEFLEEEGVKAEEAVKELVKRGKVAAELAGKEEKLAAAEAEKEEKLAAAYNTRRVGYALLNLTLVVEKKGELMAKASAEARRAARRREGRNAGWV